MRQRRVLGAGMQGGVALARRRWPRDTCRPCSRRRPPSRWRGAPRVHRDGRGRGPRTSWPPPCSCRCSAGASASAYILPGGSGLSALAASLVEAQPASRPAVDAGKRQSSNGLARRCVIARNAMRPSPFVSSRFLRRLFDCYARRRRMPTTQTITTRPTGSPAAASRRLKLPRLWRKLWSIGARACGRGPRAPRTPGAAASGAVGGVVDGGDAARDLDGNGLAHPRGPNHRPGLFVRKQRLQRRGR